MRLGIFIAALLALWVPTALPLLPALNAGATWVKWVGPLLLYGEFLALIAFWGRWVRQFPYPLAGFGLVASPTNGRELGWGLALAFVALGALLGAESWLGWATWQAPGVNFPRILAEGLLLGLGVAVAEELLFRGWLWTELAQDYGAGRATWISSGVFAVCHFLKPLAVILATWVEFPGLMALGLALAWGRQATAGRLGFPIGFHGGLVWAYYLVQVGKLLQINPEVPRWLTGINGNPLASAPGLGVMAILAWGLRHRAIRERRLRAGTPHP